MVLTIEIEKTKQPGWLQHILSVVALGHSVDNDPAFIIRGVLEDRTVVFTIRAATFEEAETKRDRMMRELREMTVPDLIARYGAAGLLK